MEKVKDDITEEELRVRSRYRDKIDIMLSRISLLDGEDKLLMTMYWENGNSIRQIGRLAGVNRLSIGRRISKVSKRLMEGQYITCLRNRDRFTRRQMAVARDYYLLGLSKKAIAEKRKLSLYRVRQIQNKIQRIIKTINSET